MLDVIHFRDDKGVVLDSWHGCDYVPRVGEEVILFDPEVNDDRVYVIERVRWCDMDQVKIRVKYKGLL